MILRKTNRTNEVLKRLNVAIWTCVVFASALFVVAHNTTASASVTTGTTKSIDISNAVSLDPSNRVANNYTEKKKQSQLQKKKNDSATRDRLKSLYSHLPHPPDLGKQIDLAARKHSVDAKLLLSICVSESHLRAKVRNKSGATGMCQVMPDMHGRTANELLDYKINLDQAARIVSTLDKQCKGRRACVIQSYNTGRGAYLKGVRAPKYLSKVQTEYRRIHTPSS